MTTPPARTANSRAIATPDNGVMTPTSQPPRTLAASNRLPRGGVRAPVLLFERVIHDHEVDRHRERVGDQREHAAPRPLDHEIADQRTVRRVARELEPEDGVDIFRRDRRAPVFAIHEHHMLEPVDDDKR